MSIPKLNKENELSNVTQPAGGQVGIQTQVFLTPQLLIRKTKKKKKRKGNGTVHVEALVVELGCVLRDEQKPVVGGAGDTYGAGGMKCQGNWKPGRSLAWCQLCIFPFIASKLRDLCLASLLPS